MSGVESLIEVKIDNDKFLLVKETLTRIGIANTRDKVLYQSCHILHKKGKYYITHFKEMFGLDGKPVNMTEDDYGRRNIIANLLEEWGLVEIVTPEKTDEPVGSMTQIRIIPYHDKQNWKLVAKYTIGNK